MSAGPSGARPPEHLSAIRLRYAPPRCARTRPARGGSTLRAPRSQGWSGAALRVLGLDTGRRMGEDRAAGVLKLYEISASISWQNRRVRCFSGYPTVALLP